MIRLYTGATEECKLICTDTWLSTPVSSPVSLAAISPYGSLPGSPWRDPRGSLAGGSRTLASAFSCIRYSVPSMNFDNMSLT